ncbi:hypothetical protein D3C84_603530 [compost metagenome]
MGQAQLFAGGQAEAEEHRVELLLQFTEAQVIAEPLPMTDFDAADFQQELQLMLGEVIHQLVLGDPVFVEATGLCPGLENHHVMAVHGTAVGAGQPGGPGTHHGNAFAGERCARERVLGEMGVIDGVALQQADQHRRTFLGVVTHAGFLAKDFRRADPGATAAEDVRGEDLLRRALDVFLMNVADERGDVDLARAGVDARGIVAVQAPRGFQVSLASIEGGRQIGEVAGEGGPVLRGMGQVAQGRDHGIGLTVN